MTARRKPRPYPEKKRSLGPPLVVTDAQGNKLELVPTDPLEVVIASDGAPMIRAVEEPLYKVRQIPREEEATRHDEF